MGICEKDMGYKEDTVQWSFEVDQSVWAMEEERTYKEDTVRLSFVDQSVWAMKEERTFLERLKEVEGIQVGVAFYKKRVGQILVIFRLVKLSFGFVSNQPLTK